MPRRAFSRMLLAALVASSAPAQNGEPVVIGRAYELTSKALDEVRRFNVYLPPGYAEGEAAYPVLYLLDGGVHEDYLHIAGIASLAADFRKIRPFLVVGIEGVDRYRDLLPTSEVAEETERLPQAGGAETFRRFLVEELQPRVRSQFRVTEETVLIGESVAGHFVVETFLRTPTAFGGYVAVSPSLWWNRQALARSSPELLSRGDRAGRRLYLTIADEGGEMQEGLDRLVRALEQTRPTGLDWHVEPMPDETHGTILHPAALAAVRRFFRTPE